MATKPLSEAQVAQSVTFLNHIFRDAVEQYRRTHTDETNVRGSLLHGYQNEFSYLIDDIQRGPIFQAAQSIADGNQLVAALKAEK